MIRKMLYNKVKKYSNKVYNFLNTKYSNKIWWQVITQQYVCKSKPTKENEWLFNARDTNTEFNDWKGTKYNIFAPGTYNNTLSMYLKAIVNYYLNIFIKRFSNYVKKFKIYKKFSINKYFITFIKVLRSISFIIKKLINLILLYLTNTCIFKHMFNSLYIENLRIWFLNSSPHKFLIYTSSWGKKEKFMPIMNYTFILDILLYYWTFTTNKSFFIYLLILHLIRGFIVIIYVNKTKQNRVNITHLDIYYSFILGLVGYVTTIICLFWEHFINLKQKTWCIKNKIIWYPIKFTKNYYKEKNKKKWTRKLWSWLFCFPKTSITVIYTITLFKIFFPSLCLYYFIKFLRKPYYWLNVLFKQSWFNLKTFIVLFIYLMCIFLIVPTNYSYLVYYIFWFIRCLFIIKNKLDDDSFLGAFNRIWRSGFDIWVEYALIYYEKGQFCANSKKDFIKLTKLKPKIITRLPHKIIKPYLNINWQSLQKQYIPNLAQTLYKSSDVFKDQIKYDLDKNLLKLYVDLQGHTIFQLNDNKFIKCTHSLNYVPKDFVAPVDFNDNIINQYINNFDCSSVDLIKVSDLFKYDLNKLVDTLSQSNTFAELNCSVMLYNSNLLSKGVDLDLNSILLNSFGSFLQDNNIKNVEDWNSFLETDNINVNKDNLIKNLENSQIIVDSKIGFEVISDLNLDLIV